MPNVYVLVGEAHVPLCLLDDEVRFALLELRKLESCSDIRMVELESTVTLSLRAPKKMFLVANVQTLRTICVR